MVCRIRWISEQILVETVLIGTRVAHRDDYRLDSDLKGDISDCCAGCPTGFIGSFQVTRLQSAICINKTNCLYSFFTITSTCAK
jgi:hypothetical protein